MTHLYSAYGLTLRTPFICEGLIEADPGAADVEVVEGSVPRELANPLVREKTFDVLPERFLFRGGRHSARFLVEQGTRVTFARNVACQNDLFQHHFLRNVMVAILRQRQLLVLHASCAVNCAKTVVVAGEPGAGKSTTMAALLTQGWRMVSDDVVALRLNDQECLEALPGAIHVYLHDDAAAALTVDTAGLPRSEWHRQKMALPLGESRSSTPGVVSKFIHLEKLTSHDLRTVHVTGHKKLPLLLRSLYGPISVGEIATRFDLFAAALRAVKMFSVARPDDSWTLDRVVALATDDETDMSDGIDYG